MHIEDRLDQLEKSTTLILEDRSYVLSSIQDHSNNIERMTKRLESTEAQIRKLFALADESRSKETIVIDGLGEIGEAIINKTIKENKDEHKYKGTRLGGDVTGLDIICKNCTMTAYYMKKYGIRRVRMDKGNVVEIAYEFSCLNCKQPIIIYL